MTTGDPYEYPAHLDAPESMSKQYGMRVNDAQTTRGQTCLRVLANLFFIGSTMKKGSFHSQQYLFISCKSDSDVVTPQIPHIRLFLGEYGLFHCQVR